MIVIGPFALLLIMMLMFRPVRRLVGWAIIIVICVGLYGAYQGHQQRDTQDQAIQESRSSGCAWGGQWGNERLCPPRIHR